MRFLRQGEHIDSVFVFVLILERRPITAKYLFAHSSENEQAIEEVYRRPYNLTMEVD